MNGLHVVQTNYIAHVYNQNSLNGTNPTGLGAAANFYAQILDPVGLQQAIGSFISTGDSKVFLRQHKISFLGHNHGLEPIMVTIRYLKYKRGVSLSDYSTIQNILQDQSLSVQLWNSVLTTGNPAQRIFKFGKTKKMIVKPNQMIKWKITSPRFKGKQISQDIELNTNYVGTKITQLMWLHVDPVPQPFFTGSGLVGTYTFTGAVPALFQFNIHANEYVSFYINGENNPQTSITDIPAVPTGSRTLVITNCNASTVTSGQPWSTGAQ